VPDGFEFAPKLPGDRRGGYDEFEARVRRLDSSLRLAFDLEHPSWDGIETRLAEAGAVRVDDVEHPAPFRYLRRREAPDAAFAAMVAALREPVYVYFRHDDEPTAPAYAAQLLELV